MDVRSRVRPPSKHRIHVVAGALFDAAGRVLVARRPDGSHLAGLWEFPGGKLKPEESRENGLARELDEELGVRVLAAHPLIWVRHRYPDRDVELDVWRVVSYAGVPYGREGQPITWRDPRDLEVAEFPPADAPVLAALRLPRRYLVTPEPGGDWGEFLDRIAARAAHGFELIQLRARSLEESRLVELGRRAADVCRRNGARLLVNSDPEVARRCEADGVHLNSLRLAVIGAETDDERESPIPCPAPHATSFLVGASCHHVGDLERARAAGCDFAVLGPVQSTPTHPNQPVLDWRGFEGLARGAGLPVFAIGGLGDGDIATAQRHGGQGVAAIRAFWARD